MSGGRLGQRLRRDRFFQLRLILVAAVVAAALVFAVLGFNLVGDVLREVYDPQASQ
jgi:ABC-type dipeptide/oligopeptide/nickel transport system permease subunit